MTATVVTETIYTKDFNEFLGDATGELADLRQMAFEHFAATGFPTVRNEDWKYTNVRAIAEADLRVSGLSGGEVPIDIVREFKLDRNGFTALHLAFAEFTVITIPKETSVAEPIEFKFGNSDGAARFPHLIVIAEPGSKATIVESYESDGKGFTNAAAQIYVGENANLTHFRVQKESTDAFHVGTTEVTLGSGGLYNSTNINIGAAVARHDVHVRFTAEGGEAFVDGLYMLAGEQHSDTHSTIDHTVPNCVSHQTYKGVLNDRSRGVFNGIVFVRENAHGTDARQSNKNLLLSNDARVDTKPQLEIFNDDVKCSHGATVGQLEDEELFYLLSRGINPALAANLLTYGFAEEIINKIGIESIKRELDEAVLNRLHVSLEV
jgi:Fe-S cluster assembly protein SufD